MPRLGRGQRKAYGWKDGDKYYLSLMPKDSLGARNAYDNPTDALRDSHMRGIVIEWENPAIVDQHGK
jgi:hypothetical protein